MHSTSERVDAIEKRTNQIKQQQHGRRDSLTAVVAAAACLALIVGIGLILPGLMAHHSMTAAGSAGAAAGVFAVSGAAGYVLIGVLAFALGCGVTILCYRLRSRNKENHHGRDHR